MTERLLSSEFVSAIILIIQIKSMKNIKLYILTCLTVFTLMACGGSDNSDESVVDPPTPEGRFYQQSVTLPSENADTTITLNNLSTSISSINGGADWLTALKQSYSSGAPSVRLKATDNESESERKCSLTITAQNGDQVVLAVIQQGVGQLPTGIDDSHNVITDQPAYSR